MITIPLLHTAIASLTGVVRPYPSFDVFAGFGDTFDAFNYLQGKIPAVYQWTVTAPNPPPSDMTELDLYYGYFNNDGFTVVKSVNAVTPGFTISNADFNPLWIANHFISLHLELTIGGSVNSSLIMAKTAIPGTLNAGEFASASNITKTVLANHTNAFSSVGYCPNQLSGPNTEAMQLAFQLENNGANIFTKAFALVTDGNTANAFNAFQLDYSVYHTVVQHIGTIKLDDTHFRTVLAVLLADDVTKTILRIDWTLNPFNPDAGFTQTIVEYTFDNPLLMNQIFAGDFFDVKYFDETAFMLALAPNSSGIDPIFVLLPLDLSYYNLVGVSSQDGNAQLVVNNFNGTNVSPQFYGFGYSDGNDLLYCSCGDDTIFKYATAHIGLNTFPGELALEQAFSLGCWSPCANLLYRKA